MRLLYILNVANRVNNFSHSSMLAAKELGIEFHIAGNWGYKSIDELKSDEEKYGIHIHQIDFIRNPFSPGNIKAYKQLNSLMKEWNFDAVHCNTPIGGTLGRLCGKLCGVKKVIYTAHGFHFYKGAPLFNITILKWAEKLMAHWTDALITMNQEDYQAASKMKLRKNGKIYLVHGVGIDTGIYRSVEIDVKAKRAELSLKDDDIVLISMGDLIKRKNYTVAIEAIEKSNNKKLHYIICGKGPELKSLQVLINELGVSDQVHLLEFRKDIKELLTISDIFLFTTLQEGMPRSMMEAMASGLPVVCSNIRGNVDLVKENEGGFLCLPTDAEGFSEKIEILANDAELRKKMGSFNLSAIGKFDMESVTKEMRDIYCEVLYGGNKD